MQGLEIVNLIFFCTRMHYEYFKVLGVLPYFSFLFEITENIPSMESCVRSVCFRGDFTIKTVDDFMHRSSLESGGLCWRIFIHMQYLIAD